MTNNPWDEEPETSVQAPPADKPAPAPRPQASMVDEGVTVTLKGGKQFSAPWIVIHAADAASALAQLNSSALKDLADLAARVGAYFAGKEAQTSAAGPSGPAPSAPTGSAKPAYQQAPGGAKYCDHGEMEFKSGTNAQGKVWSGHFCPERDKSQQCDPKWTPKGR